MCFSKVQKVAGQFFAVPKNCVFLQSAKNAGQWSLAMRLIWNINLQPSSLFEEGCYRCLEMSDEILTELMIV